MAVTQETKLKKTQCIPFLDKNKGTSTEDWIRIDKSTIFSLNPNPQTEEMDYICYEVPVTEIDHYTPELPQEIALYAGNPVYELVFDMLFNLPVGDAAKVPCMICFPPNGEGVNKAWVYKETTLTLGEYDAVEGKLSFTLNFGGNCDRGTYTISSGKPTFQKASEA